MTRPPDPHPDIPAFPWRPGLKCDMVREQGGQYSYVSPFTGTPMPVEQARALSDLWAAQQALNRRIGRVDGIARWKRRTMGRFLWHAGAKTDDLRAVWPSRAAPGPGDFQIEDGFVRSRGLGAELNAPLSVVVDGRGIYYDPLRPSDLEHLLQTAAIDPPMIARAEALAARIVSADIVKYGARGRPVALPAGRPLILVPGQVEDDRSVRLGGGAIRTNAALLAAVRRARPDAHIVYKPHPDVEAGLRAGGPSLAEAERLADRVVRDASLTALFAQVDEVHVLTSQTGFEALLRGLPVTTYGAPFYAGWGLTRDLGPVPARRTARRTLAELVAAALILYPRYMDPVTSLPCPPEILVSRLEAGEGAPVTLLTRARRLQGRVTAALRATA